MALSIGFVVPGLVPGIHVSICGESDVDGRDICAKTRFALLPGHDAHWCAYQPSHSGLRGSSTVFTFSSLMVPLAIRSLRSPSVGPEIFER